MADREERDTISGKTRAEPDPDDLAVMLLARPRPGMSRADRYQLAVAQVHAVAAVLQRHDVPALLNDIAAADAAGPVLDPTLYRAKVGAMHEDKEALEAAQLLWAFGRKMAERRATPPGRT